MIDGALHALLTLAELAVDRGIDFLRAIRRSPAGLRHGIRFPATASRLRAGA
jgi:hypothetical protein